MRPVTESLREQRGRRVREVWVRWAAEQPDPKSSWLTPWEDLDEGQREVDMRIGEALAADERERIRRLARAKRAVCGGRSGDPDLLRPFADLIGEDQP